jgi:Kdo2-lipid IVA lauroyltransferase/acyltransferase
MKRTSLFLVGSYLAYLVVRVFVCVVQAMPLDTCVVVARWLATICFRLGIRRDVVEENLRGAFPQMSDSQRQQLAWEMWEHLFLMVVEVIQAPRKIHHTNWRDYAHLINADGIVRTFFDDRPTVIVCGHYGNFELSGYILGLLGFPTYSIARPLDNPFLDRFLNEFRGLQGQHILSKMGSASDVERVLDGGGILALIGDQYAGRKGCWVEVFGRPGEQPQGDRALYAVARSAD